MSQRAARHVKAPGGPERVRSAGGLLCLRKKPPISQFPAAWVPACSRRKRTMPVRSRATIRTGMNTSWRMMPGMAFTSASVRKICQVKGTLATPVITTRTAAQTIRPPTIAASRARYRATTHCQRDRLYKKARDATVSRQLKGHGHSGHQRRHSEERHPHQRGHESHHRAIPPAADQAAEEHGQVHGQQHPADLGDLSGEEGQYQRQGQEHGRQDQVMDICFEIAVFHGVKLLLKKSFRAAFWRRTSLLAFFTESAGL